MAQKEGNGLILYSASGLTARAHARELLTLAVREVWGLSPLPEIARREGGKPFFPDREAWPCAAWTAPRWGWTFKS